MAEVADSKFDKFHREFLLDSLFKQRDNGNFTDVKLKFKSKEISAHKVVLSAASEVFSAMFLTNMRETNEGLVDLSSAVADFHNDSTEWDVSEAFIKYIYTGEISLDENTIQGFLAFSNYFMMSNLKQKCCSFLEKALHLSNSLDIYTIAFHYQCLGLKEKSLKLIEENFDHLIKSDSFVQSKIDVLLEVFSSDSIQVESEDTLLLAFFNWLDHDWLQRSKYFNHIFKCIRTGFLSRTCYDLLLSRFFSVSLNITGNFMVITDIEMNNLNGNMMKHNQANCHPRHCLDTSTVIMTTGGYDGNSCLVSSFAFLPKESNWAHLAPMQTSRHDHGTVSLGNDLFVAGGFNSRKGPLNTAEHYNSMSNRWQDLGPMHLKRKSLGICVFNGKLFVSGGLDENYNALDSVEFYDDESMQWNLFLSMNQPRYSHGFVASNEYGLFSIGGWKCSTVERCIDGGWKMVSEMSNSRAGATSVIHGHKIYVCGGYNSECISSLEIYDIITDLWVQAAPASIARWRAGYAINGDKIYIIGGRDSTWQYLNTVESYEINENKWNFETPLPCKLMGLRCSVVKVPRHYVEKNNIKY